MKKHLIKDIILFQVHPIKGAHLATTPNVPFFYYMQDILLTCIIYHILFIIAILFYYIFITAKYYFCICFNNIIYFTKINIYGSITIITIKYY